MSIEEDSIAFLEKHIDASFPALLNEFIIERIEWLEFTELRPIAFLTDNKGNKSNLICLFPPFDINKEIK